MDILAKIETHKAEMAELRLRYANSTPEDMENIQREIDALGQKLIALSIQHAAAAMTDAFRDSAEDIMTQAFTGGGMEILELLGMSADDYGDGDNSDEMAQFILDNPAPEDKAKYLPIGALMMCNNRELFETFALTGERDDWLASVESGWGIQDADDGRLMLASLLEGQHESAYGDDYRKFKTGKSHDLDEDSVARYAETLEGLERVLPGLYPYALSCGTLLAWDLERVGYLARIFTHLGWMDDAEAFDWLEKAAAKIKTSFADWNEYFASVLVGRAVAYRFDYRMIFAAYELMEENKAFLEKYPASEL